MKKTIVAAAAVVLVLVALGSQTVANEIGKPAAPGSVANAPRKAFTYQRPVVIEHFTSEL